MVSLMTESVVHHCNPLLPCRRAVAVPTQRCWCFEGFGAKNRGCWLDLSDPRFPAVGDRVRPGTQISCPLVGGSVSSWRQPPPLVVIYISLRSLRWYQARHLSTVSGQIRAVRRDRPSLASGKSPLATSPHLPNPTESQVRRIAVRAGIHPSVESQAAVRRYCGLCCKRVSARALLVGGYRDRSAYQGVSVTNIAFRVGNLSLAVCGCRSAYVWTVVGCSAEPRRNACAKSHERDCESQEG
jgi:hypothetical protein